MHTLVTRPDHVSPHELDDWLARGWYRVGQVMMTCRFMVEGEAVWSTIWTRVPLRDAQPLAGSHRKLLRRVENRFRAEIGPGHGDARHEALYGRYLEVARGARPGTIAEFLRAEDGRSLFDTWCLSLWAGDRLAGFSLFDVGAESVQSLLGAYDPDHARFSLGVATQLLEIRWARQRNFRFYYAGYVVPGAAMNMDYKLRPRGVEHLDPATGTWQPWPERSNGTWPAETLSRRLDEALTALRASGIPARLRANDSYALGAGQSGLERLLSEPLVVDCHPRATTGGRLFLTWSLDGGQYDLLHVVPGEARFENDTEALRSISVWIVVARIASAPTPDALLEALAAIRRPGP